MGEGRNVRLTELQTIMMNLLKQSGGIGGEKRRSGAGSIFQPSSDSSIPGQKGVLPCKSVLFTQLKICTNSSWCSNLVLPVTCATADRSLLFSSDFRVACCQRLWCNNTIVKVDFLKKWFSVLLRFQRLVLKSSSDPIHKGLIVWN